MDWGAWGAFLDARGNMWIKFILSGLIIAFCVLLGYFAAEKYRSRKKFFAQLSDFNERYLTELGYRRKPLDGFLSDYTYTGDFGKVISALACRKSLELKYGYLTKEEKGELEDYFSTLGRGDSASQSGYFTSKRQPLAAKKATSEKEAKAHSDLYIKLGLLAGLAFVILIL